MARGLFFALSAAVCLLVANAVSVADEQHLQLKSSSTSSGHISQNGASTTKARQLYTHYIDFTQPEVKLAKGCGLREGCTGLTVTLPSPAAVSKFMPVIVPKSTGMTHDVVDTWNALKVGVLAVHWL